ncbi:MAG: thioredoxin family protein [Planctomycetaceae bacterium]|nr:thioredoxin family protein [Planctomycetaceae bacterium]
MAAIIFALLLFFIFALNFRQRLPAASGVGGNVVSESEVVEFLGDFNEARERAFTERKPLIIFFTLAGNESCKRSFELFRNQEIKKLTKYFICATVDGIAAPQTCEKYRVNGFPTVLILDGAGKEIQRLTGKETKEQLSIQMHIAIQLSTTNTTNNKNLK